MSDEQKAARRPLRGVVALLLGFTLAAVAAGAFLVFKKPAPIDVRVTFTPGKSLRYHMVMDLSSVTLSGSSPTPTEDEIQADVTWRVAGVDPSGAATIVQTVTNPTMTSNGLPVTLSDLPPATLTVGADGTLRTSSGVNLFSGGAPGPAQAGIARPLAFLPDHPVGPGDTWSTQVSQAFWGSALTYHATSTFLRRETLGSADAAVIESDATVPVDVTMKVADFAGVLALPAGRIPKGATATYAGSLAGTTTTSWIDPSNGSLLKTLSRGTFSMQLTLHGFPSSALAGGGTGTLSGELSLQLTRI